ncbi:GNAT family N-acetyltransferase [Oceanobacillus saliphilus]|uniref:GNAT family N-acetyltransferase n=1 Tax=Oceanobacillus saliphilus TaxID=2925834 RepID=UPI00201DDF36|nr:GNAT family N-acetyltransferase [Oceanobacillus saliphilus]
MSLKVVKMNQHAAVEALCWKYEKPYDFYNNILTSNAILELLSNHYYGVQDDYNNLIGFFCTGRSAQVPAGNLLGAYEEDCVDVGIGMKPELTGKGKGYEFFTHILSFVCEKHKDKDIRLTVATFNERAIHLYEKFGFERKRLFHSDDTEFITMIKAGNNKSAG